MRVIHGLRRFNYWMHYVAGAALTVMLVVQVTNIIGRKGFDYPITGTVEITRMLLVVVVFLGLAYSEDLGDHITIDLIYVKVGPRTKAVFDVFANVLSIIVMSLIAFQLYHHTQLTRYVTQEETGILEWPIWPFVMVAAFGSALYAIAIAMKVVLRAIGEPTEAPAPAGLGRVDAGPEI